MLIQGVCFKVKFKKVTQRHLHRIVKPKDGEKLLGAYLAEKNIIYVVKGLDPQQELHTFLHEVAHMIEAHTNTLDEEAKCDAVASWMMEFYKVSSLTELFDKNCVKHK